jgi:DNA-binding NtrC family response regulator
VATRILLSMDDLETAVRVNAALEAGGYSTTMVSTLDDARSAMRRANPDLVLLTGAVYEAPARHLAQLAHDAEVSTLALLEPTDSGPGARDEHLHATALLSKPVSPEEVVQTIGRLVERRQLQLRTGIMGESPAIQELLIKIEQMAPVSSTVLIQGESGTGKELVAKAVHDLSPRRGKPFIAVNCAALPETLLES